MCLKYLLAFSWYFFIFNTSAYVSRHTNCIDKTTVPVRQLNTSNYDDELKMFVRAPINSMVSEERSETLRVLIVPFEPYTIIHDDNNKKILGIDEYFVHTFGEKKKLKMQYFVSTNIIADDSRAYANFLYKK